MPASSSSDLAIVSLLSSPLRNADKPRIHPYHFDAYLIAIQAGATAAFTVDLLVYPLDTLKTRIQSPDYAKSIYVNKATGKPSPHLFRGLYQGVGSVIIATLPACMSSIRQKAIRAVLIRHTAGAFFITYERTKALFTRLNNKASKSGNPGTGLIPTPLIHAAASSLAELVSCAILTPAEVIKQNAQMVSRTHNASDTNATLQTLAKFRQNPLALWRGYTALAGRNLPFTALQFPMLERLRSSIKMHRERTGKATGGIWESACITALSAGSAGAVAAVITTPIDVIKTRIMLSAVESEKSSGKDSHGQSPGQSSAAGKGSKNGLVDAFGKTADASKVSAKEAVKKLNPLAKQGKKSAWDIGKEIMREQGMKGMWRGGLLRAVWTFLGSGLYLGVYDGGRIYLARRRGEELTEEDLNQ